MMNEHINRRFTRTSHRLTWSQHALTCTMPLSDQLGVSPATLQCALAALIRDKCVPEPNNASIDPSGASFAWQQVGAVSYWWEWPSEGWRAATLTALQALAALKSIGLGVRDLQPSDIYMAGSRPMWVGLGSLAPWTIDHERRSLERVARFFMRPYECARNGRAGLARRLLRGGPNGLLATDAEALLGARSVALEDLATVRESFDASESIERASQWTDYEQQTGADLFAEVAAKTAIVDHLVTALRPASVLDLACNRGRYARLADQNGPSVVGIDADEECMNALFGRAASSRKPMTGIVMDLSDPNRSRGWESGWCDAIEARVASDLVIMMAVIHHLVLGFRMPADEIARLLSALVRRWLLIEFVPAARPGSRYAWAADFFSLDWLTATLEPVFVRQQVWSHGKRGRALVLFERGTPQALRSGDISLGDSHIDAVERESSTVPIRSMTGSTMRR